MLIRLLAVLAIVFGFAFVAVAQSPEFQPGDSFDSEAQFGDERRPREDRGPGERDRRGPPPNPMFEAIDADGDGVLTKRELRKAAAALKTLDADGDGNVTLEEVSPQSGPRRGGPEQDPAEALDRIMQNDANGDGKLTVDEVPERLRRMLSGADANGDEAIDREELGRALENVRGRFRERGTRPGGNRPGGNRGGGQFGGGGFGNGDAETLLKRLMAGDQDNDGMLSPDEVPEQMMGALHGADQDGDGRLNAKEVRKAMLKAQQRRAKLRERFGDQQ